MIIKGQIKNNLYPAKLETKLELVQRRRLVDDSA
jgi:hypothetical protein